MTKKKEFKGVWFFPSVKDKEVKGTLSFNPEQGATLKLLGRFSDHPMETESQEIIQGIVDYDDTEITLYKCILRFPSENNLFYSVTCIFEGVHIDSACDLKFQEIASEIFNLEEWLGVSGFRNYFETLKKINEEEVGVIYKLPETINFQINDNLQGQFQFNIYPSSWTPFQKEVILKQRAKIVISSKMEYEFSTLLDYLINFQNFIILALYKSTYPNSITLYSDNFMETDYGDKKQKRKTIKLYYKIPNWVESKKPKESLLMLFCYEGIKDNFSTIIQNWYKRYDSCKPVFNLLFDQFINNKKVVEIKFLNLAQAMETFHAKTSDHPRIPKKDFDKRKKTILSYVPEEHHKWIKEQFNNHLFLETRLNEIIEKYSNEILDKIIGDKKEFVKQIKNSRNYYTHYSPNGKKNALEGTDLFYLSEKLKIILICALLIEVGFSKEQIQMVLEQYWRQYF
jgi:hypothetical protein